MPKYRKCACIRLPKHVHQHHPEAGLRPNSNCRKSLFFQMPICVPCLFSRKFVAESLDVIQNVDWVIFLGNSFAEQYEIYGPDDDHSALLHRLLKPSQNTLRRQEVEDRLLLVPCTNILTRRNEEI